MKQQKKDCRLAVLEELCAGEAMSRGDLVRLLTPVWTQPAIQSVLDSLTAQGEIVRSTRVEFVRNVRMSRIKVVTIYRQKGGRAAP